MISSLLVRVRNPQGSVFKPDTNQPDDPRGGFVNEKEVDELIVLDIDAGVKQKEPDYQLIRHLAGECRMPLCYGGGVKGVEQVERIVSLGVEKVVVSSAFVSHPELVSDAARMVGSQSVIVVLDVQKSRFGNSYKVRTHNGTRSTGLSALEMAKKAEALGAGEIVINAINNDGVMKGYDHKLVGMIRAGVNLPMTVLGGAGSLKDIGGLFDSSGIIGAGAGSLFVFKGVYRAVLINYPSRAEKDMLFERILRAA